MISSLSSMIAPGGAGFPGSPATPGGGDAMTSAFAMLFALMPGMAGDAAAAPGDAKAKGDAEASKDGSRAEDDGKDLPSDIIALPSMPLMPFALPPVVDTPLTATATLRAGTDSPAPIASLLAAMPGLPPASEGGPPIGGAYSGNPMMTPAAGSPRQAGVGAAVTAATPLDATLARPTPSPMALPFPDTGDATVSPRPAAPLSQPAGTRPGMALPAGMEPVDPIPVDPAIPSTPPPANQHLAAAVEMPRTLEGIDTSTSDKAVRQDVTIPHPRVASDPRARAGTADVAPTLAGGNPARATTQGDPAPAVVRVPEAPIRIAPGTAAIVPDRSLSPDQPVQRLPRRADLPGRFSVAAAPATTPLPVTAPAPAIQPGQTAPAMRVFAGLMRAGRPDEVDPVRERAKAIGPATLDPAALSRTESLAPVAAPGSADQPPLDMTQHHWPQAMIDRIDRMREDAATADSRIQLSPDALGGIAVAIRREDGATHIHFTAEQAQTATLLADAQPTLAQLAEDRGMKLGQTAVDLGQSGHGERQSPQRQPDPVIPARPAFAGAGPSGEAGDSPTATAATTRIA